MMFATVSPSMSEMRGESFTALLEEAGTGEGNFSSVCLSSAESAVSVVTCAAPVACKVEE